MNPSKLTWKQRLLYTRGDTNRDRGNILAVINNMVLHLHPAHVPAASLRFTYTWGLGGISAVLFLMLGLTGLMLMFRYDPRVSYAYTSIQALETQVMFGSLLRGIHHWSANLLVITTSLHLVRVMLTASYKQGRTTNWLIGLALLVFVLAANFTGYLLPWDQLAYWAITVSTNLLAYLPLLGEALSHFLLGGHEVGQTALNNFYAIHVVTLPIILAGLMGYHFWKIRKNGGITQPIENPSPRTTTMPNLVSREFAAATVVLTAVVLFAMFVPAPLEQIANPLHSPNPAKAAWYFAGLQELLLHMHPLAAMGLTGLVLLGLVLLPRWDREEADIGLYFRSPAGRWAAITGALLSLNLVPLLVLADEYWLDLAGWLPGAAPEISGGLIPFVATAAGLVAIYFALRGLIKAGGRRANHSEALLGLFVFLSTGLVLLTIIGVFFRGPNMALVLPF